MFCLNHYDLFLTKCRDAFLACLTVLVISNGVSIEQVCIALMTGMLAGFFCVGSSIFEFFAFGKHKWLEAWITGILVMMADMIVHPTHFGNVFWVESFVVGCLAAAYFLIINILITKGGKYVRKIKRK